MKLKFRVWEGEKYLSLSKALKEGLVGVQYDRDDSFGLECYYEHVIIEMFTGLTDKNGVEIYEGDIVLSSVGYKRIVQHEIKTRTEYGHGDSADIYTSGFQIYVYGGESFEVVGNIHEVAK